MPTDHPQTALRWNSTNISRIAFQPGSFVNIVSRFVGYVEGNKTNIAAYVNMCQPRDAHSEYV